MEKVLAMSKTELKESHYIKELSEGKLSVLDVSELIGKSERTVYRKLKRYREQGEAGLIHRSRGKPSNRGYPCELRAKVIELFCKEYRDYGPTLYSEVLSEHYGIELDPETIRRWLIVSSRYTASRKQRPHRRKRQRRGSYGQLLQLDGSYHDWFEGRGKRCSLYALIDDATNRIYLRFAKSENSEDMLRFLRDYCIAKGIPRSIYTDRSSVLYAPKNNTDVMRALSELQVEIHYANSPQAKGRVERAYRTLQDRLVKALRRKKISSIEKANEYLEKEFIAAFNARFSLSGDYPDVHLPSEGYDFQRIFSHQQTRQVRNDYTINLQSKYIQLLPSEDAVLPLPKRQVTLQWWLDGSFHIYYQLEELDYEFIDQKPAVPKIIRRQGPHHPWFAKNKGLAAR